MSRPPRLRITHVVFSFDYGGLERRILRLIGGLSPRGIDFRVVSLRPSDGAFLARFPSVEHVVLDARPGVDAAAIGRLARLLQDTHVVHSHNWVSMLEGIVAGRLARVPAVVHGEHGASRFEPAALRWQRTAAQRLLARAADALVPVNESIRDRLCEVWRLPAQRCTVIRNGVDTERYRPATARAAESAFVIGSISRLEAIKNFPCLVRAVHALNAGSRPGARPYRLVIVGEGSERRALESLVAQLDAADYVSLPGAADDPENWYPRFDAYVNCSFSEGMSNTVLEAMACGLPVVATDVAGHRDWLRIGDNALFFRSDDHRDLARQFTWLAANRAQAEHMGMRNRRRVLAEYSEDRFIEAYCALYHRVLSSRGIDAPVLHPFSSPLSD